MICPFWYEIGADTWVDTIGRALEVKTRAVKGLIKAAVDASWVIRYSVCVWFPCSSSTSTRFSILS